MGRSERMDAVLASLLDPMPAPVAFTDDAFDIALASLTSSFAGDFERGAALADLSLRTAVDPDAVALARAVAGLAIAGWPPAMVAGRDPVLDALSSRDRISAEFLSPVNALLTEAALACARLDLAAEFHARIADTGTLFGREDHPFLTVMRCTVARVRLFAGDVSGADALVRDALRGAEEPLGRLLAIACAAVIDGNADRRSDSRRRVAEVLECGLEPSGVIAAGVYLLAAFAAIAQGDVATSARLVLRTGVGPDLGPMRIVDRAIAFEVLVRAAVDDADLDAALAWESRALPLATHPNADSTVTRIRSRVALLRGDAEDALDLALLSIDQAIDHGRVVEASEGEILAARARIALPDRGTAARRLEEVVVDAGRRGHHAVRLAAARELRAVGRRLPPSRAAGWAGLSAREQQVALLVGEGRTNAEIATATFLSEHTVRAHVSRVLRALGVGTRAAVAVLLPITPVGAPKRELTPRQWQIGELIADGASNRMIADDLGIGVSTVEKHVGAILRRWELPTRTAIARVVTAARAERG